MTANRAGFRASFIEKELFDVLTADERGNFILDKALERINKAMEKVK